ncbi:MAG: hypothetical protein ACM3Q4_06590, partial [Acidobacteriota bacterium]
MKNLILLISLLSCSSSIAQVKVWRQTQSEDFAAGTFDNIRLSTIFGGELQLIHPLVHIGADTLDASLPQFI